MAKKEYRIDDTEAFSYVCVCGHVGDEHTSANGPCVVEVCACDFFEIDSEQTSASRGETKKPVTPPTQIGPSADATKLELIELRRVAAARSAMGAWSEPYTAIASALFVLADIALTLRELNEDGIITITRGE